LPRKTLVLATMLWSAVDWMAVFPRALARDLRAGGRGEDSSKFQVQSFK